jgi:hypothetical protein
MEEKLYLTFIFFIICLSLNSQNKNDSISKSYKITLIERPQTIELIEYSSNKYSGKIITEWAKGSINNFWFKRLWNKLWKIEWIKTKVYQDLDLKITMKLIDKLEKLGIETIKDCNFENNFCDGNFLDGDSHKFIIKTKNVDREYYFEEIYPYDGENKEKNKTRNQAQKFISIIYENIDLDQLYVNAVSKLGKGTYFYSKGAGVIQFKIRKRKK